MTSEVKRALPLDGSAQGVWAATIATDALNINDPVDVTIPDFVEHLRWGPCRWQARGDNILPVRGDEALVQFDNRKQPWIVAWWPNRAVSSIAPSRLTPGTSDQLLQTIAGIAQWTSSLKGPLQLIEDAAGSAYFRSQEGSPAYAAFRSLVTGDTEYRHDVLADGKHWWGDGATQDTNLYRSAANVLATDDTLLAKAFNWNVGSSPPSSPIDGTIWIYNGIAGIYWMFIYDSSEATYKWKFIGGPSVEAISDTSRGTSGTTWFVDPVLTVPRSGDYKCTFFADAHQQPNANTGVSWALYLGDGSSVFTPIAGWRAGALDFQAGATNGIFWRVGAAFGPRTKTLSSGTTLKLCGVPAGWDFNCDVRGIAITPIRII